MNQPPVSPATAQLLRLHMVDGVGPILAARLLERFSHVDLIFSASRNALCEVRGIGPAVAEEIKSSDPDAASRELDRVADADVRILSIYDADYPALLRHVPDPPLCLYVLGQLEPEDAVSLAIVGSRNATTYGLEQAERFGLMAAESGLTVVSGLARGVDRAAHFGAIRAPGRTIAVLGMGLSHVMDPDYADHALVERMVEQGAVVSEFPIDFPPRDTNFPRRNRIIAGMTMGVMVVEAPARSGALITSRYAIEYNRDVFALPGRIDTPQSIGCHELIQRGAAKLVMNLNDILEELGDVGTLLARVEPTDRPDPGGNDFVEPSLFEMPADLSDEESTVVSACGTKPVTLDRIAEKCDLPVSRIAAALTRLTLRGLIRPSGSGYVRSNGSRV